MINLLLTLVGAGIIIPIDATYLYLNQNFYKNIVDPNEKINWTYAILTWVLIVISIQLLVLSQKNLTNQEVFMKGAFLGLAMYGVYNLTSASLYPSKWTKEIAVGDTLWGMVIVGTMGYILNQIQNQNTIFN